MTELSAIQQEHDGRKKKETARANVEELITSQAAL